MWQATFMYLLYHIFLGISMHKILNKDFYKKLPMFYFEHAQHHITWWYRGPVVLVVSDTHDTGSPCVKCQDQ